MGGLPMGVIGSVKKPTRVIEEWLLKRGPDLRYNYRTFTSYHRRRPTAVHFIGRVFISSVQHLRVKLTRKNFRLRISHWNLGSFFVLRSSHRTLVIVLETFQKKNSIPKWTKSNVSAFARRLKRTASFGRFDVGRCQYRVVKIARWFPFQNKIACTAKLCFIHMVFRDFYCCFNLFCIFLI